MQETKHFIEFVKIGALSLSPLNIRRGFNIYGTHGTSNFNGTKRIVPIKRESRRLTGKNVKQLISLFLFQINYTPPTPQKFQRQKKELRD